MNSRLSLRGAVSDCPTVPTVSYDEVGESVQRVGTETLEDVSTALAPTLAFLNGEACRTERACCAGRCVA